MTYVLAPIKQNTPLRNIPLQSGRNVIGRMAVDGVSIVLTDFGVPKNLVKFISRKHAEIQVQGDNLSLIALASLQVSA